MSERKSGAGMRCQGYEEHVTSDSSNLWLDESGDSGTDEVTAGGGLPVGGLGVIMRLAKEAGVIGPPVAVGRPYFLGQNEYGMTISQKT